MRRLIGGILLVILIGTSYVSYAGIRQIGSPVDKVNSVLYLLNGQTTTNVGDGEIFTVNPLNRTIDAKVVGTGAVTATVIVYVSNTGDDNDWIVAATITLSGTTSDVDGFVINAKWAYMKAEVSAISGTSAAVTATMGV